MKTNKAEISRRKANKNARKELAQNLAEKFLDIINRMGHNPNLVADEVGKLGKTLAKKLSKNMEEAEQAIASEMEKIAKAKKHAGKTMAKKPATKAEKAVNKAIKKAKKTAKPASSVKVNGINSVEKAERAINQPAAKTTKKPPTLKNTNPDAQTASESKTVVKAVGNNPVEKVAKSNIPKQPRATRNKTHGQ